MKPLDIAPESKPEPDEASKSLFDRVGGRWAIAAMVRDFYDSMFADSMIGHMFVHSDKERLISKEVELLSGFLGGPIQYSGRALRPTHARFAITGGQFLRRLVLLEEAMRAHTFPEEAVQAVLSHTKDLRSEITREAGSDCHG